MLSRVYQGPTQMVGCSEFVQSDQCVGPVNQNNARYHVQINGKYTNLTCFDKYIPSSGRKLCQSYNNIKMTK